MVSQFVKYTPDVETDDPEFDKNLQIAMRDSGRFVADSVINNAPTPVASNIRMLAAYPPAKSP